MIKTFTDIGHVELDGDRMRLVGAAPKINGVYAWLFDERTQYIGVAKRKSGGLHSRLSSYLRRSKYVSHSNTKGGPPGTTSAMRDAIRFHIEEGGTVTIKVVTVDEMPDGDVAAFEKLAIQTIRPPLNKNHNYL